MQRLKQNDGGAALPLDDNELLSASTTQSLPTKGWCEVRMRLSVNGEAERSVHLYDGRDHSAFFHEAVVVPGTVVAQIAAAVRAAFLERAPLAEDEEDSQALYRTFMFREGGARPRVLAVEYQDNKAVGPAAAFEAAWRLLAGQFPSTQPGREVVPGLWW